MVLYENNRYTLSMVKPNTEGTEWAIKRLFRIIIPAVTLVLFLSIISPLTAAEKKSDTLSTSIAPSLAGDPDKPWEIDADEVNYDRELGLYVATGNVVIKRIGLHLKADHVQFDPLKMKALAKGNVHMTVGEDILTGDRMEMDLETKVGSISQGEIYAKEDNFHIRGDHIRKVAEDTYTIDRASITTCDGENPDWKITGRDLKVTLEGYGFMKHAAFWIKKVPVFYTPFIFFPAKRERQTGFLFPEFGNSDRLGIFYIQPFFWAISDNMDATFYEQYMSQRGFKHGAEFRYIFSENSKGAIIIDYFYDDKIDDGIEDHSKKWGFDDDSMLRTNHDRFWFRMSHHQELPAGFNLKLDLDFVSDQDYLLEFEEGATGFEATENYFNDEFTREMDDYNDPVRVNRLNISKNWFRYSLIAELRWYDDIRRRRWKDFVTSAQRNRFKIDDTLHKLPYIEFDATKQRIFKSPFYFTLDTEYDFFYRKELWVNNARGQRVDIYPRIYLPYRFKHYFTFEPSAGVRQTAWLIDKYGEAYKHRDKSLYRTIYDVRLDLSSEISKVYASTLAGGKVKHAIRPQIIYTYIPDRDQDEYPYFNSLDRIEAANQITYSLTNTLTSKGRRFAKKGKDGSRPKKEPIDYKYNEFLRVYLEQTYDFNENQIYGEKRRRFSPIFAELEISPVKYFSFEYDTEISPYDGDVISQNVGTRIWDTRGDDLKVEYRYLENDHESITVESVVKLFYGFSVYGESEYNFHEDEKVKNKIGMTYEAQCWSVDLKFTDTPDDDKFEFLVNLEGLGKLRF